MGVKVLLTNSIKDAIEKKIANTTSLIPEKRGGASTSWSTPNLNDPGRNSKEILTSPGPAHTTPVLTVNDYLRGQTLTDTSKHGSTEKILRF